MSPPSPSADHLRRRGVGIALAASAVLLMACLAYLLPVGEITANLINWIDRLGPWGYAMMILAYVASCLLFVPGSILTLASGAMFGLLAGTAVVSVGSTAGAAAAFLVGRYFARSAIEHRIATYPKFTALDGAVGRSGFKIVLLTRLSPAFPFNLLNYGFGLTGVSFRDYLLASWIGMLPATALYVYIGATAKDLTQIFSGDLAPTGSQTLMKVIGLAATLAVTVYVTRIARKALREALPDTPVMTKPIDAEGSDTHERHSQSER